MEEAAQKARAVVESVENPEQAKPATTIEDAAAAGSPNVFPLENYGVGIDCHSKFFEILAFTKAEDGYAVWEQTVAADFHALRVAGANLHARLQHQGFLPAGADCERAFVYTLESTGCYHLPLVLAWGGQACLVNPLLANPSRRKTDRLDARMLATHTLSRMWPRSYIAPSHVQELRLLLAQRRNLGRKATAATNRVNNILLRWAHTLGKDGAVTSSALRPIIEDLCFERPVLPREGVSPIPLPPIARMLILGFLEEHDACRKEQRQLEKLALLHLAETDWPCGAGTRRGNEVLALLRTVPGLGPVGSLVWLAEVADASRFPNSKAAAAYAGCDPSVKVSAGHVTAHMKRGGNEALHHALLQGAQVLVCTAKEPIGQWGRRIWLQGGRGAWFRAASATARRMAAGAYHVHSKGEPFSYAMYKLDVPQVEEVPLAAMRLSPRTAKLLTALGLETSTEVADAWMADLRNEEGVGRATMQEVRRWLDQHRQKATPPTEADPRSTGG
ncbi:MAG: IS110 family transposase [Armatimonadetes bacterium]|nr:IS110 family transposase [Armatimonadota bacterium]